MVLFDRERSPGSEVLGDGSIPGSRPFRSRREGRGQRRPELALLLLLGALGCQQERAARQDAEAPPSDPADTAVREAPLHDPIFRRFWLSLEPGLGEASRGDAQRTANAAVASALGEGWRVEALGRGAFAVARPGSLPEADAPLGAVWDEAYALRALPSIELAEPHFVVESSSGDEPGGERCAVAVRPEALPQREDLPDAASDPEWSLGPTGANVLAAHQLFASQGREPGAGLRLGHPDTGYRPHPEIWPRDGSPHPILADRGWDYVDDDADPTDDLAFLWPGHGTKTASVVVSPKGAQLPVDPRFWVSGVAPGARVVPLRVTRSVAIADATSLALAIERAAGLGPRGDADRVDVVSISLGGIPNHALRRAVRAAWRRNLIVLAAAGNQSPWVVWPARYDEVVAVAATNVESRPWRGSSRGWPVDVAAPGESVWCAGTHRDRGDVLDCIGMSSGTSFAVATTAGVALLWLDWHRASAELAALRSREGAVPWAFARVLKGTSRTPSGWEASQYGDGIVDAAALLQAQLPAPPPAFEGLREETLCEQELATLASLFERVSEPRRRIARLFGVPEDRLCEAAPVADEVVFHYALDGDVAAALEDLATPEPPAEESFARARAALRAADSSRRLRSELRGP